METGNANLDPSGQTNARMHVGARTRVYLFALKLDVKE